MGKSKMVTERDFSSVFDYSSAFQYGSPELKMKPCSRSKYKSAFSYQAISISSDDEIGIETSKEQLPTIILRNCITFILYAVTILLFPVSFWICVKRVHSLERIVLMRLGKLQPVKGPGYAFILPFVDKWMRVDLRPQNFTVSTSQLLTADGGVVEAKTDIEYRVADVINYVLKLDRQESTLKDLGLFCLTNIVSEKDQEDLDVKRELVSNSLKDELNRSFINWGLEVDSVYLHSVKVLKAPEPVDAIGTLMNALKAATGGSSQHMTATFPVVPEFTGFPANSKVTNCPDLMVVQDNECHDDYADTIKSLADSAMKEGMLKDLSAIFRFDIVGRSTRTLLISCEKGNITVTQDVPPSVHADVQLMLSEDNLKDFLAGNMSPLEAYMDGKVMVTGDWSLLRSLAKVFDLCKSK